METGNPLNHVRQANNGISETNQGPSSSVSFLSNLHTWMEIDIFPLIWHKLGGTAN